MNLTKGRVVTLFAISAIVFLCIAHAEWINRRQKSVEVYRCRMHIEEICRALLGYKRVYGYFPPASLRDPSTGHYCSWRLLLLNYMDYAVDLSGYRKDSPWNAPINEPISRLGVLYFQCPEIKNRASKNDTSYAYLTDYSNAGHVVLVELPESHISWAQPSDVNWSQFVEVVEQARIRSSGQRPSVLHLASIGTKCQIVETQIDNIIEKTLEMIRGLQQQNTR